MSTFDSGSDSEAERALREALTSRLLKRDVNQRRLSHNSNQQRSPNHERASTHSPIEDGAYHSPSPHSESAAAAAVPASIDEALLNPQRISKWATSPSPERSPDVDHIPYHTRKRTHGEHERTHAPEPHASEKHAHYAGRSRSHSSSQRKADRARRAGSASPEPLRTESISSTDDELVQADATSPNDPVTPSETPVAAPKLPPYLPAIMGCRSVDEFECLNRIEEGTYGIVFRARDRRSNEIVALKRLKMEKEKEGFPITSLREINTLLKAQHENIVNVREIVVGASMDKIYIVMEFVEHDLRSLMESMKKPFEIGQVKTLTIQLLRAVGHMHANWILHRDLKCSNLLLSNRGMLKVGDFGLAREYGSPLKQYTPVVVTLWYRAPELLLGVKEYSTPVDLWSVGCIFAELLLMKPLWRGRNEMEELNLIFKDLGTPSERIWPGLAELPIWKQLKFTECPYNTLKQRFATTGHMLSESGFELLNRLFTYFPPKRISAADALEHRYWSEHPLPTPPDLFPSWPSRAELSAAAVAAPGGAKVTHRVNTPPPPSAGKAAAKLRGDDDDDALYSGLAAPPPFTLRP